jgi:glycosyltransferase involved in cell wall biosynthesis
MIIHFFQPPLLQRTGGLELAIGTIAEFLRRARVTVSLDIPLGEIGRSDAELVHFHGLWQPHFSIVSASSRRKGVPYVVSPHGMLEPWAWRHKWWKKWPWFFLIERPHLLGARSLLTTSDSEARHIAKLFPHQRCYTLPLGLSSSRLPDYAAARRGLDWKESEVVLLFLSRLHPKKGLHLLLRALLGLNDAMRQRMRLVIVGAGKKGYVHELQSFTARERARLPRIDWAGEIWGSGKWVYFQAADLFCLPSYSENFGFAILEALQVGTRVLTTNKTPWSEVPVWNAGWIVEPNEASIREALVKFVAHPEWSEAQRKMLAGDTHRRFSWKSVGPAYLRFYADTIQSARQLSPILR